MLATTRRDSYRIALDLFAAAEELGYDSGWVAQHHFLNGGARLPSTLTFLAAAAERTRRIQLGTAIVILPLEDPIRVAEDAAVVDTISGGRLQLGLGTGGDPLTFAAFGRDLDSRRDRFAGGVRVIHDVLGRWPDQWHRGALYPPAPTLPDRIWESTLSTAGADARGAQRRRLAAGAHGVHEQRAHGRGPVAGGRSVSAQARRTRPRIGLSRAVYPACRSPDGHRAHGQRRRDYVDTMVERGFFPPGLTPGGDSSRSHIHYGHPEQVVESLRATGCCRSPPS